MILDGREVASKIKADLKIKINKLNEQIRIVVISIAENHANNTYIKAKEKACEEVGITLIHKSFLNPIEEEVISYIETLNEDDKTHGILLQLPITDNLNQEKVLNKIHPKKDIDGLTSINKLLLKLNKKSLVSCTAKGILRLLEEYQIPFKNKKVCMIGRSELVGIPTSILFQQKGATVQICHSKTINIENFTKPADIIVIAIGVPKFLKKEMVREGAIIVDVGINYENGLLVGDADYYNLIDKCSFITPVPGGIGPMTVAMLLENTYFAYLNQKNKS